MFLCWVVRDVADKLKADLVRNVRPRAGGGGGCANGAKVIASGDGVIAQKATRGTAHVMKAFIRIKHWLPEIDYAGFILCRCGSFSRH
jgi:hypothetical protein